jgi:glycosyltransferase involved in cell wall biosynthesis
VVPVFENAATLDELVRRTVLVLEREALSFELLFVDDGSRDGSWDALERLREADRRVRALRLARNFGQASALSAGFDHARGRTVVTIDADLQLYPEDIPALLAKRREGHDLVSGVRLERADPLGRLVPSWLFNRLVHSIIGIRLRDYGCGLNALSRELALELSQHGEMRRFLKPLAAMLARSVGEVPVRHAPSPAGRSRYTFMSLVGVQFDFFTSFSRKPFQVVGIAGLVLFALGLLGGLATLLLYVGPGVSVGSRVQTLVILAMIFGLQLAVLGLLGEFVVRIHHARSEPFYVVREEDDP